MGVVAMAESFEPIDDDPKTIKPVTAYETPPPAPKKTSRKKR
jgi:hypothetical protein